MKSLETQPGLEFNLDAKPEFERNNVIYDIIQVVLNIQSSEKQKSVKKIL